MASVRQYALRLHPAQQLVEAVVRGNALDLGGLLLMVTLRAGTMRDSATHSPEGLVRAAVFRVAEELLPAVTRAGAVAVGGEGAA